MNIYQIPTSKRVRSKKSKRGIETVVDTATDAGPSKRRIGSTGGIIKLCSDADDEEMVNDRKGKSKGKASEAAVIEISSDDDVESGASERKSCDGDVIEISSDEEEMSVNRGNVIDLTKE